MAIEEFRQIEIWSDSKIYLGKPLPSEPLIELDIIEDSFLSEEEKSRMYHYFFENLGTENEVVG